MNNNVKFAGNGIAWLDTLNTYKMSTAPPTPQICQEIAAPETTPKKEVSLLPSIYSKKPAITPKERNKIDYSDASRRAFEMKFSAKRNRLMAQEKMYWKAKDRCRSKIVEVSRPPLEDRRFFDFGKVEQVYFKLRMQEDHDLSLAATI